LEAENQAENLLAQDGP